MQSLPAKLAKTLDSAGDSNSVSPPKRAAASPCCLCSDSAVAINHLLTVDHGIMLPVIDKVLSLKSKLHS